MSSCALKKAADNDLIRYFAIEMLPYHKLKSDSKDY
jgi:hypothetical protein